MLELKTKTLYCGKVSDFPDDITEIDSHKFFNMIIDELGI